MFGSVRCGISGRSFVVPLSEGDSLLRAARENGESQENERLAAVIGALARSLLELALADDTDAVRGSEGICAGTICSRLIKAMPSRLVSLSRRASRNAGGAGSDQTIVVMFSGNVP